MLSVPKEISEPVFYETADIERLAPQMRLSSSIRRRLIEAFDENGKDETRLQAHYEAASEIIASQEEVDAGLQKDRLLFAQQLLAQAGILEQRVEQNAPRVGPVPYETAHWHGCEILDLAMKRMGHNPVEPIPGYTPEIDDGHTPLAALVTESLIDAEIRDHDTHGWQRYLNYVLNILRGIIKPDGKFKKIAQSKAGDFSRFSNGYNFGQRGCFLATQHSIRMVKGEYRRWCGARAGKPRVHHTSAVKEGYHGGRLFFWTEMAMRRNCIANALFNSPGSLLTSPIGGKKPTHGTNPVAKAIPGERHRFSTDFGTTAAVEGQNNVRRLNDLLAKPGSLRNSDGTEERDPNRLYDKIDPAMLEPIGGEIAKHKIAGFSQCTEAEIDVFAGRLAGETVPPAHNQFVISLANVDELGGPAANAVVDEVAERMHASNPDGRVWIPGEQSDEKADTARSEGIYFRKGTYDKVDKLLWMLQKGKPNDEIIEYLEAA